MMEKDPDDRYESCAELLKDLNAVKNNKSTSTSAKKKKQFKAPVKQSVNKESGLAKNVATALIIEVFE